MQNNHLSLETIKRIALVIILCFIGALQRNTISACYDYSVERPVEQSLRLGMSNDEFNRMTFTPITGAEYVSRNVVNFNGRKKGNNSKVTAPQHSSSAIKAIPVAVLIAMSPLNTSSVASEYSPMSVGQRTEQVARSNLRAQNKEDYSGFYQIESENDYMRLIGITNDDDVSNYEKMVFNYDFKTGDSVGWVQGRLVGISKERRADGSRLIAYFPIDEQGKTYNYRLAYMPSTIAPTAYVILCSKDKNNGAVGVLPESEFIDYFGGDAVKEASELKDQVMGYKDTFKYDF